MTEAAPEWLAEDRDAALVWQSEQAHRCPNCGTWDWEWEEDENAWYADTWTCLGCKGRDGVKRDVTQNTNQNLDGLQIRFFREARDA